MDLIVEVSSVEIAHSRAGTKRFSVELREVDEGKVREKLPEELVEEKGLTETLDNIDLDKILDYVGAPECVEHFGNALLGYVGVEQCAEHFGKAIIQCFSPDQLEEFTGREG